MLILRDRNMPGWTAKVDGTPAQILPGRFREVRITGGSHRVEFRYWPPALTIGLWLLAAGTVALAFLLVRALVFQPKRNTQM
jgi:uncharacterized membrane protein YfhO